MKEMLSLVHALGYIDDIFVIRKCLNQNDGIMNAKEFIQIFNNLCRISYTFHHRTRRCLKIMRETLAIYSNVYYYSLNKT